MNLFQKAIEYIYFHTPGNLALYDRLTGLRNRNYWDYIGKKEFEDKIAYFTMIDVNDLKKVNDSRGHLYGDNLLKRVADILRKSFGNKSDVIIHLSGDEFLLITKKDPTLKLSLISDAFCYGCYMKKETDSIYNACKLADMNLYEMKKLKKKGNIDETRD